MREEEGTEHRRRNRGGKGKENRGAEKRKRKVSDIV